jgi:hypothetical protein
MLSEARKQWDKENKVFYGINLTRNTDSDLITYLDTVKQNGGSVQGTFKEALRFYLASSGNIYIPPKSDMQETSD